MLDMLQLYMYLRAMIICRYKVLVDFGNSAFSRYILIFFSEFSKLTFYLFENVQNLNIRGYNF